MKYLMFSAFLLALSACALDGVSSGGYASSQANLCPLLGNFGASIASDYMQQGILLDDVFDMLDARQARTASYASQPTGRYTRWVAQYVYLHPHWTHDQARIGVEQACLRAALR